MLHETWIQSSDLLLSCQLILREGEERQGLFTPGYFMCFVGSDIHLICYFWPHKKNGYKSDLELGLPHYHVKAINNVLHFIHHQPIKISKIATGEIGIRSGKISNFTFSFIRGSLRVGLLAISVAMRVALTLSYLTITCHIAYNTLSHVCFLTF